MNVVMITGHRPKGIGGYSTPNPTEQWVRRTLQEILTKLKGRCPEVVAVSGMALGVDLIFVEACVHLGIPFVAAVPFTGQESRWPEESQNTYHRLLQQAQQVVVVDEDPMYFSKHFGGKMVLRNKWGLDHSDHLIAVWDGSPKGGTANTVQQARKMRRGFIWVNPQNRTITTEEPHEEGVDVFDLFG